MIGNYAYVGGGIVNFNISYPFYKFDPSGAGSWTLEQSIPTNKQIPSSGFSIGDKGYAVEVNSGDIYQYASGTNIWTDLLNSGEAQSGGVYVSTFALGNKGYIKDELGNLIAFDPAANGGLGSATSAGAYPLGESAFQASFVIGGAAYIGGGVDTNNGFVFTNKFYKYTNGAWTALNNLPSAGYLSAFSIGQYGYIIQNGKTWRYNPSNDSWTQLEDFPGTTVYLAPTFSISQKGYISTGGRLPNGQVLGTAATWEYDPSK